MRVLLVIPATVIVGAVLLLGGGCATVPPNRSPDDPFVNREPLPVSPPQQNARPEYSFPQRQPFAPFRPYPDRSSPRLRTPTPTLIPQQPVPQQQVPQQQSPKTFVEPESAPRRPGSNPAPPYRTDKAPNPRRPTPQVPPQQAPKKQPAPVIPVNPEGPTLFPPEDMHTATKTSLPKSGGEEPVELSVIAPERRPVGSGAPFQLTIKNTSPQILRNVHVVCEFDDALTFPGSDRKSVTHKIPKIDAGDARESLLTLLSDVPGLYHCRFTVTLGGKSVAIKTVGVEFVSRQLDWHIHGPAERTVGSRAEFNIPVINVTDRDLKQITVRVDLDAALTIREMTQGGKLGDRSVTWTLDTLAANEGLLLQLEVECREPTSQACLTATVSGEEVPADDAEACLAVKPVTGLLDVRVQDLTDPVAVGEEAEFVVTIINQGLQSAKDIVVTCRWPDGFDYASAAVVKGGKISAIKAVVQEQSLSLPPISQLEADQRIEYRLKLSALRAGAHQLTVSVSESASTTPIEVIEPIMVHQ